MKRFLIFLSLVLVIVPPTLAQENVPLDLEVISSENLERIKEVARWEATDGGYAGASFNPNGGSLALALNDGTIQFVNPVTYEIQHIILGVSDERAYLYFNPDGSRIIFQSYDLLRLWDTANGELLVTRELPSDARAMQVSANLQILGIWRSDYSYDVYDLITGEEYSSIPHVGVLPSPELSFSGTTLISSDDVSNDIYVWNTLTGEQLYHITSPLQGDVVYLWGSGFAPDGRSFWANWQAWSEANGFESIIRFWSAETGDELFTLTNGGIYFGIVFAPMGSLIATGGQTEQLADSIVVWDLETKIQIADAGYPTGGGTLGFSPDGQLLAVQGGTSRYITIWDANMPEVQARVSLEVDAGPNTSPQFSPAGRLLLTVNGSTVRLWGVEREN
jgi:WD40 repeat protein